MDLLARATITSNTFWDECIDHAWVVVPTQILWAIVWGLVLGFFMDVGCLVPMLVILGVSAVVSTISHVVHGRRTVVDSMADTKPSAR